eukprot:8008254-Pyramimonas_sp.AAC.1
MGPFGGTSHEATERVMGSPLWRLRDMHAGFPTAAFGGGPYRVTKRVKGCAKGQGACWISRWGPRK